MDTRRTEESDIAALQAIKAKAIQEGRMYILMLWTRLAGMRGEGAGYVVTRNGLEMNT